MSAASSRDAAELSALKQARAAMERMGIPATETARAIEVIEAGQTPCTCVGAGESLQAAHYSDCPARRPTETQGAPLCKHCGGTDAEHMQGDDGLLCDYDRMLPPLHARPTETPQRGES